METRLHDFERAGLGAAPFRFIGMEEKTYQACHGAPVQPGSSCDYCGTAIRYVCWIKSSDGKQFKVGTDCVHKAGDAGLAKQMKSSPEMRKMRAAKAKAKDDAVSAELAAILANPPAALVAATVQGWVNGNKAPVPALPWFKRSLEWSGAAGRARNLRLIKSILAGKHDAATVAKWTADENAADARAREFGERV